MPSKRMCLVVTAAAIHQRTRRRIHGAHAEGDERRIGLRQRSARNVSAICAPRLDIARTFGAPMFASPPGSPAPCVPYLIGSIGVTVTTTARRSGSNAARHSSPTAPDQMKPPIVITKVCRAAAITSGPNCAA